MMKPEDFEPIAYSSELPEQYAAFKKKQEEARRQKPEIPRSDAPISD